MAGPSGGTEVVEKRFSADHAGIRFYASHQALDFILRHLM
jgi:hypothetical protein